MRHDIDCAVIGAGVVGLAVARELALGGREVVVLEKAEAIGTETSSRNSEVIHAGLYYPSGSLKARLCLAGRDALYAYMTAHGIPHRRCGKLVVATHANQLPRLKALAAQAEANGVNDLEYLPESDLKALEPALSAIAGLHSPSSGILDTHQLMLALQGDAENAGAMVALKSPVVGGYQEGDIKVLRVGGDEPMELACAQVVNAAGLWAQEVSAGFGFLPPESIPRRHLAKGSYFTLSGRAPFSRLVYPLPETHGLGIHLTLDLGGQARFGPDVEWVDAIDYAVDPARAEGFYDSIRRYWPALPDGVLQPGYAGIRPKLSGPGSARPDFLIQGPADHGLPGVVVLYGMESPGLTACLAIARHVADLLS